MSYGIMAFRVSADKVTRCVGSGDATLLHSVTGWSLSDFDADESAMEEERETGDYEIDPVWAIRDLVMGRPLTLPGIEYARGYQSLIRQSGETLNNGLFYPVPSEFLTDEIDPQLTEAGATVRMGDLLYGGALINFPAPDDFPFMGHWKPEAILQSAEALRSYTGSSQEVRLVREWCELAAPTGETIVGFYE